MQRHSSVHNLWAGFWNYHHRLARPSSDVLQKVGKYIKDFLNIKIPAEHICPGFAQGKMTNKSFLFSEKQATELFQLIHSDLKALPTESYRKYRCSIVYYDDDYTSHAWTINLHSKDAALPATKQFIAMVETQYHAQIQSRKSDTGGDYKSKAFVEMLKDRGINICFSSPESASFPLLQIPTASTPFLSWLRTLLTGSSTTVCRQRPHSTEDCIIFDMDVNHVKEAHLQFIDMK